MKVNQKKKEERKRKESQQSEGRGLPWHPSAIYSILQNTVGKEEGLIHNQRK